MEFKVEVKESVFECNERYVESQLHRSTNNIEACNDKPDDKPEIEIKAEIKKEHALDDQVYNTENQLTTSLDLGDLKNEPDEYNSEKDNPGSNKFLFLSQNSCKLVESLGKSTSHQILAFLEEQF
ncbi:unnamed protein product [Diabrotica balteata]|uniref:Uncharacterized protein n=1 Tax=Diabrotica balteata TaxID=107213 RepID=A0A9N9T7K5_DIABA|nr:unnamed protein product [Diabrotica balteata]